MKLFLRYIRHRLPAFLFACSGLLICAVVMPYYGIRAEGILYSAYLFGLFVLIFMIYDFSVFKNKYTMLRLLSEKLSVSITADLRHLTVHERQLLDACSALEHRNSALIAEAANDKDKLFDYFTTWAHQIKTPISAMSLLLQKDESQDSLALKTQLFRTEQYVEMALAYARLDSPSGDLVFRRYKLDDLVGHAVRRHAILFIEKDIAVDFTPTNEVVLTDEKWLTFVIEQVISNAIKYTNRGTLKVYSPAPGHLAFEDSGIGIAPEDLPRIWEKGYTGYNGRSDKRASGIGLYLSRQIMTRLGYEITARSELGVGTTVTMNLNTRPLDFE